MELCRLSAVQYLRKEDDKYDSSMVHRLCHCCVFCFDHDGNFCRRGFEVEEQIKERFYRKEKTMKKKQPKSLYQAKEALESGNETSDSLDENGYFAKACVDDVENPHHNDGL